MWTYRLLVGFCLIAAMQQAPGARADDRPTYDRVSFYFAAHQDDWQLFMNPSAFLDVASPQTKVVFVHMTAGDAGLGIGRQGRRHPYYLARENGADAAIRFMVDVDNSPGNAIASTARVNGHPIHRVSYRSTVSYYLRLPDGNPEGTGYYDTGYQSLRRFREGDERSLSAVDGSTTYHGWTDLVATMRAILDFERERTPAVQVNVADLDPRINPNDHSDHRMTAKAALDSVSGLACVRRAYYVNYASARLKENLTVQQRDLAAAVFAVTAAGIRALGHSNNWRWYDQAYVGRDYFRIEEGNGRCGEAAPQASLVNR